MAENPRTSLTDTPLYRMTSSISRWFAVSMLWILCSLPIVTMGAATAAAMETSLNPEGVSPQGLVKGYFGSFRKNFSRATGLWLLTLAALAFGGVETALYGAVAIFVSGRVMDTVLYGLDTSKVAYIVSDSWRQIADALLRDQERGVTILRGQGAWTGTDKQVLMVAFKQKEIVQIKRVVHDTDPKAFMIVCDAHDVLGEGFGDYQKEDI